MKYDTTFNTRECSNSRKKSVKLVEIPNYKIDVCI